MSNPLVILTSAPSLDSGTFGQLTSPLFNGKKFYTLELPWLNNQEGISCILPAPGQLPITYPCVVLPSEDFGCDLYHVQNTQGRTEVMIHWGNWAGNKNIENPNTGQSYKTSVQGCILLGLQYTSFLEGQEALLLTREAIKEFMAIMNNQSFDLQIVRA